MYFNLQKKFPLVKFLVQMQKQIFESEQVRVYAHTTEDD